MKIETSDIIYLLLCAFNAVTIHNLTTTFLRVQKSTKLQELSAYITFFLCTAISGICIKIPMITLIISWIAILRISLLYREKLKYNLIYVSIFLCIIAIPQYLLGHIIGGFVSYIISMLLYSLLSPHRHEVTLISKIAVVLIPAITLAIEVLFMNYGGTDDNALIYSVFLTFGSNSIVYFLNRSLSVNYIKNTKVALLEKENELYCRQCEIMKDSTDELQAFRHDLNNQFIAMSKMLSEGKYDEVNSLLNTLFQQTQEQEIYSNTGNTPIDSIVNYKLQNTSHDNIDLDVQIAVPADIKVETADIITIIGNLLDNAMTALLQCDRDNRSLLVKIAYTKGRLVIRIANTYVNMIQYADNKIVTTKADTVHHGYGLKNISNTVEKYNGYMEVTHNDNKFTVDILLYLE